MRIDELLETMIGDGWSPVTAKCWQLADFRCVYCGMNFLASLDMYWLSVIDHLLPQSKFEHLREEPTNLVLACRLCNYLKRSHVLDSVPTIYQGETSLSDRQRGKLIAGYQRYIEQKRVIETHKLVRMLELVTAHRQGLLGGAC
jgi:hypothetical protein